MLRKRGVVGKFVEFFGPGVESLSLADRATIANMAPEYGATMVCIISIFRDISQLIRKQLIILILLADQNLKSNKLKHISKNKVSSEISSMEKIPNSRDKSWILIWPQCSQVYLAPKDPMIESH